MTTISITSVLGGGLTGPRDSIRGRWLIVVVGCVPRIHNTTTAIKGLVVKLGGGHCNNKNKSERWLLFMVNNLWQNLKESGNFWALE